MVVMIIIAKSKSKQKKYVFTNIRIQTIARRIRKTKKPIHINKLMRTIKNKREKIFMTQQYVQT